MSTTMPATRGTPVIYIVDDEESVRKGLSRLMRSAGTASRLVRFAPVSGWEAY